MSCTLYSLLIHYISYIFHISHRSSSYIFPISLSIGVDWIGIPIKVLHMRISRYVLDNERWYYVCQLILATLHTYKHISAYNTDTSIVTTNFSIKTTINWHNDDDQRNRRQIASNLHSRVPAANIQIHMYLSMYVCTLSEYFLSVTVTHYDDYTINCGRSSKCVCVSAWYQNIVRTLMCVRLSRVCMYLDDDRHQEYTVEYYTCIYICISDCLFSLLWTQPAWYRPKQKVETCLMNCRNKNHNV